MIKQETSQNDFNKQANEVAFDCGVHSTYLVSDQCDQVWRNLASFATKIKYLAILRPFI